MAIIRRRVHPFTAYVIMGCFHPIPAFQAKSGAVTLHKQPRGFNLPLLLPCSDCIGCRTDAAKAWALRCHLEAARHQRIGFTTLTYDDQHVPPTLSRRELQLFLKRLRRSLPAKSLRFFGCGEYGETTGRPHYHAILYGTENKELVDLAWGKGFTSTEPVTPARINYVAGYTAKKIGWRLEVQERIDYETGEIFTWQPPFIQMSRRPGIGAHARQWVNSWRSYAIYNGVRQPVPRFFHEAWKAQATEKEIQALAREKAALSKGRDRSEQRLRAAERIAQKSQEMKSSRRKL